MAPPKKTARKTRTRSEVAEEAQAVRVSVQEREELPAAEQEVASRRVTALKTSTEGLTIEAASKKLTDINLEVSKQFQTIQTQIQEELARLSEIRETIVLLKAEVAEIHGKDALLTDIKARVKEHEELIAKHYAEAQEFNEAKEKRETEREADEEKYEAERDAAREREEAEYAYNLTQKRKLDEDQFNQKVAAQKYAEGERQRDFTKQIAEREAKMQLAEKELIDLRAQVAAFPELLKKEADKASAIVGNVMKKDHANEITLMKRDMESAARVATLEIASAKQTALDLNTQLTQAKADLKEAQAEVARIANKALEASSGSAVTAALQKVMENNSNNGQSNNKPSRQ